jgi:hypothetical protein
MEQEYLGDLGICDILVHALAAPSTIIILKQWPRASDRKLNPYTP